jgi:uncharacterized protein
MRHLVAALLAHGLAAWLVLWWPFAGRVRYRRLAPRGTTGRWTRSIRRKWLAVAMLVPIAVLSDVDLRDVGIRAPTEWASTAVLLLGAIAGGACIMVRLRLPGSRARLRRVMAPFVELVPHADERLRFVGLAVTAGVTEELLYRSFGLAYVHWLLPGLPTEAVVLLVAAAFGLAHLYQGPKNVVLTGLLGLMFGLTTVDTRSVLPAILVHTLIDLRILLLTPLLDPDPVVAPAPAREDDHGA